MGLRRHLEVGSVAAVMGTHLKRVLEAEVMDTLEEASDYDSMDHGAVNARFCDDLLAAGGGGPVVLDLGTGTARIPIALCARDAELRVTAIDLAEHMLAVGRKNVASALLEDRITLQKVDAKGLPFPAGSFDSAISNSIIHHIPDPTSVLAEMARVTRTGGLVFVRDLVRPSDEAELARLVELHGGAAPSEPLERAAFERQVGLFRDSLRAALSVDELRSVAEQAGMFGASIEKTSDRHITLTWRKP